MKLCGFFLQLIPFFSDFFFEFDLFFKKNWVQLVILQFDTFQYGNYFIHFGIVVCWCAQKNGRKSIKCKKMRKKCNKMCIKCAMQIHNVLLSSVHSFQYIRTFSVNNCQRILSNCNVSVDSVDYNNKLEKKEFHLFLAFLSFVCHNVILQFFLCYSKLFQTNESKNKKKTSKWTHTHTSKLPINAVLSKTL